MGTKGVGKVVVAGLAGAAGVCAGVPMAVVEGVWRMTFGRNPSSADCVDPRYTDYDASRYPRSVVRFASGANQLTGYLYETGNPVGLAIFVHGMRSDADTLMPLIAYYHDCGWAVFAFDCTGTRASEGDSVNGLYQHKYDLEAALVALDTRPEFARVKDLPRVLVGHSMGGYAVLACYADGFKAAASAAVAPVNSSADTLDLAFEGAAGAVPAKVLKPFFKLRDRIAYGEDADLTAVKGINATTTPIMVVTTPADTAVPFAVSVPAHKTMIFNPNVEFVEVTEGARAEHSSMWYTQDAAAYVQEVWAERNRLRKEYGTPIPSKQYLALLATVDKQRLCHVDEGLLGKMETFCREAVGA